MRKRLFGGKDNIDIAQQLDSLGIFYQNVENYEKAMKMHFEAL